MFWAAVLAILVPFSATAGRIVLRIEAGNPLGEPQTVEIKANLPSRVRTNDVLDLDGLELGYDVRNDVYYVFRDVELGPKDTVTYNIEIRDIWTIEEEDLAALDRRARQLSDRLRETDSAADARDLRSEVSRTLGLIRTSQEVNTVLQPMQHIRAYEDNLGLLTQTKTFVGRLENLVLGVLAEDPGTLMGVQEGSPAPRRDVELEPDQYKSAVIRITVRNTSPTETQPIDIRRDLPPEIKSHDILDAGGLEVGVDARSETVYVYLDDVEVRPGDTVSYDVMIRDKWNVNGFRVARLKTTTGDVLERVAEREIYTSIEQSLKELLAALSAIEAERGPTTLNDDYVAFYREQADRLDVIERDLLRIQAALREIRKETRWGFKLKPPSMRTTWLVIYIILGFLGLMSLLFFLRWYGRSKAEELAVESPSDHT